MKFTKQLSMSELYNAMMLSPFVFRSSSFAKEIDEKEDVESALKAIVNAEKPTIGVFESVEGDKWMLSNDQKFVDIFITFMQTMQMDVKERLYVTTIDQSNIEDYLK